MGAGRGPAIVNGDPELLAQAVRNLVENALRHGGGTPVDVSVTSTGTGTGTGLARTPRSGTR
ncbi:hypothetical protein ACIG5E_14990 [Kitasatospora sp. NPDC053057]|uniref:hypothetical protein n=1 Tax=Kitasatospora sp. NPDC053057 TaxID=3364062 RepID=UPI0037CC25A8